MDTDNTKAAWQSRAVILPFVSLIAYWVQQRYGVALPVDVQGYVVDIVPLAISALVAAGIWFRVTAKRVIDRWL